VPTELEMVVYYRQWDDFAKAAGAMVQANPSQVRYCSRWRYDRGLLVLKVTDNSTCVKFKTRSTIILNRFEVLNRTLMATMQNQQVPSVSAPAFVGSVAVGADGEEPTQRDRDVNPSQDQAKKKSKRSKKRK